jgi:hypothetical protein
MLPLEAVAGDTEISAMSAVVAALAPLDDDAQRRVASWVAARYLSERPTGHLAALRTRPRRGGRPYSDTTEVIIESLRSDAPATPSAVASRTGLDRNIVKVTLNRLEKSGVLTKEARGLYRLAGPDARPHD